MDRELLKDLLDHLSCEVNLLHQKKLIRQVLSLFDELQEENDKLKEQLRQFTTQNDNSNDGDF